MNVIGRSSLTNVASGFLTSDEFRLSTINEWYLQFLRRPSDSSGGHYWLNQMKQGTTQDAILSTLLASNEYRNLN